MSPKLRRVSASIVQVFTFTDSSPRLVFTTSPVAPTQSPRLMCSKPAKSSVTRGQREELDLAAAAVAQRGEGELALRAVQHHAARDRHLDAGLRAGVEPVVGGAQLGGGGGDLEPVRDVLMRPGSSRR